MTTMGKKLHKTRSTRRLLLGLLFVICFVTCSTWWLVGFRFPRVRLTSTSSERELWKRDVHRLPSVTGLIVNSTGCRLPDYDPWDASVAVLVKGDTRFAGCQQDHPVRLTQEGRRLRMVVSDAVSCRVRCCYRSVTRKDEGTSDDNYQISDISVCFGEKSAPLVNDEFIRVRCSCDGSNDFIYEDFRAFIVPKPNMTSTPEKVVNGSEKLNVYLLGLDSISRLQLKRFMPNIEALLNTDFDAVPMEGLTKVGVNTFPNMLALLAGMEVDEIEHLRDEPFDDLPFIWKDFSRLGYATMFNEDTPSEGMFNFLKKGFFKTPTDFYLRPFYRAIEDSKFVSSLKTLCVNQRAQLDLQLQWLQDLMMTETTSSPQFALMFSSALSHKGPLPYIAAMEDRLEEFLLWYRNSPRYNNSIMLLFSDHGMRFGEIMRYELGWYESRLPFFYIMLPDWYAARYPDRLASLRTNSRRLTTFFDVHATLREILHDAGAAEADLPLFRHPGVSLFHPVPEERSCEDAGIAPHWCVCRERRPMPLDDAVITGTASAAVQHINTVLLKDLQAQCAELTLAGVSAAFHTRTQRGGKVLDTSVVLSPFEEYVVKFVTEPGSAEFEATVRAERPKPSPSDLTLSSGERGEGSGVPPEGWKNSAEQEGSGAAEVRLVTTEGTFRVMDVSRLNMYRGQSDCLLTQWDERRFCYCRNLL